MRQVNRAYLSDRCGWKVFTGNELAALLGWWMFFNWKETHPDPGETQSVFMLATTVSSKILQAFARIEGFHFEVRDISIRIAVSIRLALAVASPLAYL